MSKLASNISPQTTHFTSGVYVTLFLTLLFSLFNNIHPKLNPYSYASFKSFLPGLNLTLKPIWDLTTSIFTGTHGGKLDSDFGSY